MGYFIFVDGGMPHSIGPACFMIELQEPSDLMVVSEKCTPSGRKIPDRRIDMGLSFELMMDVYDYTPMSERELKKRIMPTAVKLCDGVTEILGPDTTDKFKMIRLDGSGKVEITKKYAVAICISGNGKINDICFSAGERACIKEEGSITFSSNGDFSVIVCF